MPAPCASLNVGAIQTQCWRVGCQVAQCQGISMPAPCASLNVGAIQTQCWILLGCLHAEKFPLSEKYNSLSWQRIFLSNIYRADFRV